MEWGLDNSILYLLCKVKQKPFKCPDGTIKFLYKNPDDFVKDIVNQYMIGIKISMNETGLPEIGLNLGVSPEKIRKNVDSVVEQTRLHMKALYETYSINPCDKQNYELFVNSIFRVIEMGTMIKTLKEVIKQAKSLDERYEQLHKLADSEFDDSETMKMARRATQHLKKEYIDSIPLEISGLLNDLNNKFDKLTDFNGKKKSKHIKKKKYLKNDLQ